MFLGQSPPRGKACPEQECNIFAPLAALRVVRGAPWCSRASDPTHYECWTNHSRRLSIHINCTTRVLAPEWSIKSRTTAWTAQRPGIVCTLRELSPFVSPLPTLSGSCHQWLTPAFGRRKPLLKGNAINRILHTCMMFDYDNILFDNYKKLILKIN